MTQYFEYKDERSSKFWEIILEAKGFTVRYGKIGTNGQMSRKNFATDATARAEHDKLIEEKMQKGYLSVKATEAEQFGTNTSLVNQVAHMTKEAFEQKFGQPMIAKAAHAALQTCVDNLAGVKFRDQPALFAGTVWNMGYLKSAVNPSQTVFDYEVLAQDLTFVEALAGILKGCVESSDQDCPYYPFRMELGRSDYQHTTELLQDFVRALDYQQRPNSALTPGKDNFTVKEVSNGSFIFTQLGEYEQEEIGEYLAEDEIKSHQQAEKFIKQAFKKIYKCTITASQYGRFCVTYPMFVFGITPQGTALGVFTVRTDT